MCVSIFLKNTSRYRTLDARISNIVITSSSERHLLTIPMKNDVIYEEHLSKSKQHTVIMKTVGAAWGRSEGNAALLTLA